MEKSATSSWSTAAPTWCATSSQLQDYTNYARGVFASYYQCAGYSTSPATGQCYTPSTTWTETERNTHQSQELRLSTPDDKRIRGLVGVYWENYNIVDQTQWTLRDGSELLAHRAQHTTATCPSSRGRARRPISPNPPTGFFDDVERGYKQLAEFASIDVDLIPNTLTLTGGIRHFKYDDSESGGDVGSFYCKVGGAYGPRADDLLRTLPGPVRHQRQHAARPPHDPLGQSGARQLELAHHRSRPAVLHLVAELPGGPVQSRIVVPPAGPRQSRSVLRSGLHGAGQRDQQRDRLEDRMVRSPRAIQRLRSIRRSGATRRPGSSTRRAASATWLSPRTGRATGSGASNPPSSPA